MSLLSLLISLMRPYLITFFKSYLTHILNVYHGFHKNTKQQKLSATLIIK